VVNEIAMTPEMLAAGLEALREARLDCLSDGEMLIDLYLAMRGMEIKALRERVETLH
jgi:hypothetical protein